MFTCAYCGTQFIEHKPNCSNCGAAIKIDSTQPGKNADLESIYTTLYSICDGSQDNASLYFDDSITPALMKSAMSHLNMPASEKIIMLYDDTIFNSTNKVGFAICEKGIYWKNDWSVDTKRNYLSWGDFAKREVALDGLHINLGKGDRIGMAGCGSDTVRDNIIKMLKQIQASISA